LTGLAALLGGVCEIRILTKKKGRLGQRQLTAGADLALREILLVDLAFEGLAGDAQFGGGLGEGKQLGHAGFSDKSTPLCKLSLRPLATFVRQIASGCV
jgi:hypothetical protein